MKQTCPYCSSESLQRSNLRQSIVKAGTYYRSSDRKSVQRYKCKVCNHFFSSVTGHWTYFQKLRHLNSSIFSCLAGSVSLRETARILKINRKTVQRQLIKLGHRAQTQFKKENKKHSIANKIQFDDMETFEHTKCKPVAISLAVVEGKRRILDFQICKQPAKGLLVKKSLKKYGKREDERPFYRELLFKNIKTLVTKEVQISTDESTHYIKDIKSHFPESTHVQYKGRRGCVVGQGELKQGGFDPLFSLNHTAAMARYKISRLVRRTWVTTKKIENLRYHFAIMAYQHNLRLQMNC